MAHFKFQIGIIVLVLLLVAGWFLYGRFSINVVPSDIPPQSPLVESGTNENLPVEIPDITVMVENLTIPWDIAFLPASSADGSNGKILITERTGNLVLFDSVAQTTTNIQLPGVEHSGEGGLLGIVLHPNFATNKYIYLYRTTSYSGSIFNTVSRFVFNNENVSNEKVIIDTIPGAPYHDGGRMAFGPSSVKASAGKPDYYLYITTGDATKPKSAQDITSLAGKILRLHDDGSIPVDNPFRNAIYSYGHRNPQGITWDADGRLWSTEHGRSGVLSGLDELNYIEPGKNYGWPDSEGDTVLSDTIAPVLHSGPDITWAPASAVYWDGSIFFGGLRGEALYEAILEGERVVELRTHFSKEYGRIRTVILGPDGMLYITTSNRDNRGDIRIGDDKLIRLNPAQFRR
jgi:aldose sugar dehydrogenase